MKHSGGLFNIERTTLHGLLSLASIGPNSRTRWSAKAMPVIFTLEALRRQRPLPHGALIIVTRGEKKDEGGITG
jgi:hypothetical protein